MRKFLVANLAVLVLGLLMFALEHAELEHSNPVFHLVVWMDLRCHLIEESTGHAILTGVKVLGKVGGWVGSLSLTLFYFCSLLGRSDSFLRNERKARFLGVR